MIHDQNNPPTPVQTGYLPLTSRNEPTRHNPDMQVFLFAPSTYYLTAIRAGVIDEGDRQNWRHADAVDTELRQAIARRTPVWHWLNRELWAFLAFCHPAARHMIPQVLNDIEQTIFDKEWYELVPYFELVQTHTLKTISIQHAPRITPRQPCQL